MEKLKADIRFAYQNLFGGGFVFQAVNSMNDPNGRLYRDPSLPVRPQRRPYPVSGLQALGRSQLTRTCTRRAASRWSASPRTIGSRVGADYDDDLGPNDLVNAYTRFEGSSMSEELRVQSTGDGPLRWLAGGYYTGGTNNSSLCCGSIVGGSVFSALPGGAYLLPSQPDMFTGFSGFTDEQYDLTSNWTLGAGLRYDDFKDKAVNPAIPAGVSGRRSRP